MAAPTLIAAPRTKLTAGPIPSPLECCCPIGGTVISEREALATATVFKALADPGRVRIVNMLTSGAGPMCVCQFTEELGLSQGTVSFHLRKLLAAGLIQREQRGTWAFYSLDRDVLGRLAGVFELDRPRDGG